MDATTTWVVVGATVAWLVAYYLGWWHGYKDGRMTEREGRLDE